MFTVNWKRQGEWKALLETESYDKAIDYAKNNISHGHITERIEVRDSNGGEEVIYDKSWRKPKPKRTEPMTQGDKEYLAAMVGKTLAFPHITKLSELFGEEEQKALYEFADTAKISNWVYFSNRETGAMSSEYRKPSKQVLKYIRENMLPVDYDSIYFEVITRDDGSQLVTAKYNQILGSRWLAIL